MAKKKIEARKADPITFGVVAELGAKDESEVSDKDLITRLVEAELQTYGSIGLEPCVEAMALIEEWSAGEQDCRDNLVHIWRACVARYQSTPPVEIQSDHLSCADSCETCEATQNDAEISGEACEAWDRLMSTRVTVTPGKIYVDGKRQRQSTPKDQWTGQAKPWEDWIEGDAGNKAVFKDRSREPWGLSRHTKSESKDGTGYVFGNCNQNRTANSVTSVCALVMDVDSGHVQFGEAVVRCQKYGCAFIAHTSYSNQKTLTELNFDSVHRHAKCGGAEPSLEQVKSYLLAKKGMAPNIADSAKIVEMKAETPDGWKIVVEHAPISKYRLIFPLAEGDVGIQGLAGSQRDAQAVVSGKVKGLAEKLGIPFDGSAVDISRFHNAPRHGHGAQFRTVIHRAPPIRFADVPFSGMDCPTQSPRKRRPDVLAMDGTQVSEMYDRYAKRWMLAEIAEHCGLETSATAGNATGKFHVRCPFAHGHTDTSDDGATCVWDADPDSDGAEEYARVKCQHESCGHRHAVDYIGAWIDNGELDAEVLQDP